MVTLLTCILTFWDNRAFGEGNWGFASSYFYPSLHRPVETSTYSKHIGNNALWEYEQLMVPIHLPSENHWLLVLISVLNVCLYIYDSARCTAATYRTIFDAIKEGFIRNELQWVSDEDRTLFQEDNWDESTPQCPKQKNDIDCGVFTCLFAKHLATLTVVERQPFRPYSQRRASRWNGQRFLNSCVSFAHWKRLYPKISSGWQTASTLLTTENPQTTS